MIADYQVYHGAVLAELARHRRQGFVVRDVSKGRRLDTFLLDERVAMFVKHCAARMHPWKFAFSRQAFADLEAFCGQNHYTEGMCVFVCSFDGMVCISISDIRRILFPSDVQQLWIRVERKKRCLYEVRGPAGTLPSKKPAGLGDLLARLGVDKPVCGAPAR